MRSCLFFLVFVHLLLGCTTVETKSDNQELVAVYVPPFYHFLGPAINVGDYSEGLRSRSRDRLLATIEEMDKHRDELTPEQMYSASVRLYELGEKDLSVLWFYRAFYRSQLINLRYKERSVEDDTTSELISAYSDFHRQIGPYVNGYAGCDIDAWLGVLDKVKAENAGNLILDSSYLKEITASGDQELMGVNQAVSDSMDELSQSIEALREDWQRIRTSSGLDARFCN